MVIYSLDIIVITNGVNINTTIILSIIIITSNSLS